MKLIYIDVETTGLDAANNSIVQLAGIIEIDGVVKEEFDIRITPLEHHSLVDENVLAYIGINKEQIYESGDYIPHTEGYKKFKHILEKYVNPMDRSDKFYFVGYNCHSFDTQFIRSLFGRNDDPYFGSYFWNPSIDVMLLAAFAAMGQRFNLPNFKLMTVAMSLGIDVDEDQAHDALYDVRITRALYKLIESEYHPDVT